MGREREGPVCPWARPSAQLLFAHARLEGPPAPTAQQVQHSCRPHASGGAFWASQVFPGPAGSRAQLVLSPEYAGFSNSLSTEYLRRKLPLLFFFFSLREREREGAGSQQRREREGGWEKPTASLQSRSQASLWGSRGQGAFNLGVQAKETKRWKLEYITALNDLSASIRLNISG